MESSLKEAQRLDAQIRKIHRELVGAKQHLESLERERDALLKEEPELEDRVSQLRRQLCEIQQANGALQQKIENVRNERCCMDQAIAVLEELVKSFECHHQDLEQDVENLSDEEMEEIKGLVGALIENVERENCLLAEEEYGGVFQELKQKQEEVDRELSVLEAIECDDWECDADVPIWVNEFCEGYPGRREAARATLSRVCVPCREDPPSVLEQASQVRAADAPDLTDVQVCLDGEIRNMQKRRDQEFKIIQDQLNYFRSLKSLMAKRECEMCFDQGKFTEQMNKRVAVVSGIEVMKVVEIPDMDTPSDVEGADPCAILANEFNKFKDELMQRTLDINLPQEDSGLKIAPFRMPPEPVYVKESRPSQDLAKLTEQLRQISESAKRFVPDTPVAIDEVSGPVKTDQFVDSHVDVDIPPRLPDIEQLDSVDIEPLKELVTSKLGSSLAKQFEEPALNIVLESEVGEEAHESVADESELDADLAASAEELNKLLEGIASFDMPSVPNVRSTPELRESFEKIDTQPLLDAVDQILSCRQQSASSLRDEIKELEERIETIETAILDFGEEEEIKEGELEELQREIDDLTRQRDEEERELKQIIERLKSLRDKREAQEAQNDGLREELANADDIDQEISEKEPKLREARDQVARKRRAFEEERAALLELMKQMNPT